MININCTSLYQKIIFKIHADEEISEGESEEPVLETKKNEPQSNKSVAWEKGVKSALFKAGLYKAFPDDHPILLNFCSYMKNEENNCSESKYLSTYFQKYVKN